MIPNSVPIIGSGFDSVANQISGWANFNKSVEEGNLARQTAAEQSRNNYFAQVADQARRDAEADHTDSLQQQAAQRHAYEFGVNRTDALKNEADRAALQQQQLGLSKEQLGLKREEIERTNSAMDNAGNFLAPDINKTAKELQDAKDEYEKAQRAHTTAMSAAMGGPGGNLIKYNKQTKLFDPATFVDGKVLTGDDLIKAQQAAVAANQRIQNSAADFNDAENRYANASSKFKSISDQASRSGLLVNEAGTLANPYNNKTYQFTPPVTEAPVLFRPVMGKLDDRLRGYTFGTGTTAAPTDSTPPPVQTPSGPVVISTKDQYDKLPSGTSYVNARTKVLAVKP